MKRRILIERIPGPFASLYEKATRLAVATYYSEVAEEAVSFLRKGKILDLGTGPGYLCAAHSLIEKTGECTLNVASTGQTGLAAKLGATHGMEVDKFKEFEIPIEKASKIKSPLIAGSYANLECKVITSHQAGNYIVYLVEVVAYKVDANQVPIAWHQNKYFALDKEVG